MRRIFPCFLLIMLHAGSSAKAQDSLPYFKPTTAAARAIFRKDIIEDIINNFSLPLNAENEQAWISAFSAVNLIKYETAFVIAKINYAANHLSARSVDFKKSFLELVNSDYAEKFIPQVKNIFNTTNDPVLLAMAANYILPKAGSADKIAMQQKVSGLMKAAAGNAIFIELAEELKKDKQALPPLKEFFSPYYLPGQVLVLSFQRHNRNFPGIAIVRKTDGSFLKDNDGNYFSVGQLARSESNMPGYISLGNTPQGIFRMNGLDTSKNFFIGPATNIQLTMPFESNPADFYQKNTLPDTAWTLEDYKSLLPASFKNYHPLFGTFYAGQAGRTEIIAHGTATDPAYYSSKTYYPYTPSAGCLVAKESWNEISGTLQYSDELLLTKALARAGDARGYLIVIEIDDKNAPVSLQDIQQYLP